VVPTAAVNVSAGHRPLSTLLPSVGRRTILAGCRSCGTADASNPRFHTLITCKPDTEDISRPVSFASIFTKAHSNRLSVNFSPFMEH
jgi:hypothetical protein